MASDGVSLTGLWFEGQKYFGEGVKGEIRENGDLGVFHAVRSWLDRYFDGDGPPMSDIDISPAGSVFRQMVWRILTGIPNGCVITYGEVAREVARIRGICHMSAQAVGNAVGHNPIAIIIPCHRVIGADGSLRGYAGGIERKSFLLQHESRMGSW